MTNYKRFKELEARGIDLVELLGGDRPLDTEEFRSVVNQIPQIGDELYADLLYLLTYRRFPVEEAQAIWRAILKHKRKLESKLGRDPGVRLSALDYLCNVRQLLHNPRLVDKEDFDLVIDSVSTDDLTGLYNRRHMNRAYRREIRRARRYGKPLTLLLIDVDKFKDVNDTFGHPAGDEVLVTLARLLQEVCRDTDIIGRWGGDEMLALLPETRRSDAFTLAERIRTSARESEAVLAEKYEGIRFSLSIGLASYPEDSQEAEELVQLADEALYSSKGRGRDLVSFYDHSQRREKKKPG